MHLLERVTRLVSLRMGGAVAMLSALQHLQVGTIDNLLGGRAA
jgi:hypothetical protein